jgi:hypothetical protein
MTDTNSRNSLCRLPQGGATSRPRSVFWAERLASKNDLLVEPSRSRDRGVEGKQP